jgi:hypothetical protein
MIADIQSLLGSLTIGLGGTAGFLAVIDWLLPETRKKWISDRASTIWIWLSYQQSWPYIRKLRDPRAFNIFFAIGVVLVLVIAFKYIVLAEATVLLKIATGVIVLIPVAILLLVRTQLRRGLTWLTSVEAGWKILIRSVVICVIALTTAALLVELYNRLYSYYSSNPFPAFSAGMVVAISVIAIAMLLYALLLFTVYIVGIYLMICLFKISEFVVLRVAEYDKGPVLGLAALLTGIGTALKALVN